MSQIQEISPWTNIKSLNKNIRGDFLSGITVAIIALPLALAFGEISQLGPIAGIWGAIAGGIFGGLISKLPPELRRAGRDVIQQVRTRFPIGRIFGGKVFPPFF